VEAPVEASVEASVEAPVEASVEAVERVVRVAPPVWNAAKTNFAIWRRAVR